MVTVALPQTYTLYKRNQLCWAETSLQLCDDSVSTAQCAHPVSSVTASSVDRLGCARGFVHHVKVQPEVQPVQQKLRWLPFKICDVESKELQKLVQQDVIEPVDAP